MGIISNDGVAGFIVREERDQHNLQVIALQRR